MEKPKKNFSRGLLSLFVCVSMMGLFSACSSTKILQERDDIPPPKYTPPSGEAAEELPGTDLTAPETSPAITSSDELPDFPKIEKSGIKYTVKKGDSFWKISRKYGVSMKELAAYNNMDLKKPLLAGKVLEIPPGGSLVSNSEALSKVPASKSVSPSAESDGSYTVKPGDSLWLISRKFGTTVNAICSANGISKSSTLKVGQKLVIPEGKINPKAPAEEKTNSNVSNQLPATTPPENTKKLSKEDAALIDNLIGGEESNNSNAKTESSSAKPEATINYLPHTVKEGDTWDTISEMYGVSIDSLKKANPKIASEKEIKIGTVINIPEE